MIWKLVDENYPISKFSAKRIDEDRELLKILSSLFLLLSLVKIVEQLGGFGTCILDQSGEGCK